MNTQYPNSVQRHPSYFYTSPTQTTHHITSGQDVDVKPYLYPSAGSMMASSPTSPSYSSAEMDARTRNARAQARHRAKRKAYIAHLEASLATLQATVSASSPDDRLQQLQEENTRLRQEADMLRTQLKAITTGGRYPARYPPDELRDSRRSSSDDSGAVFNNPPLSRTAQSHLHHSSYSGSPSDPAATTYTQDRSRLAPSRPLLPSPYRGSTAQGPSNDYLPPINHQTQYRGQYPVGSGSSGSPNPSDGDDSPEAYNRKPEDLSQSGYVQGGYLSAGPSSSNYQNGPPQYSHANSTTMMPPPSSTPSLHGRHPSNIPPLEIGIQGWNQEQK